MVLWGMYAKRAERVQILPWPRARKGDLMGTTRCGSHNRICCDVCGKCPSCYGFRMTRVPCPVGWCGPWRVCPECKPKVRDHSKCRVYSAKFHGEQARQKEATSAGLPVIRAGVNLPNGRVFAWTTQGNYEVESTTYHAGLEHPAHVLSTEGATGRNEERPAEVYA